MESESDHDAASERVEDRAASLVTFLQCSGVAFLLCLAGSNACLGMLCLLVLFFGAGVYGLRKGLWRSSPTLARISAAGALGLTGTWVAVELSTVHYTDLDPWDQEMWRFDYETDRDYGGWETAVVAGFPVFGLRGHDGMHFFRQKHPNNPIAGSFVQPAHIPPDRGLNVLWIDSALWLLAAWLALILMPSHTVARLHPWSLLVAAVGFLLMWKWLAFNSY